MNCRRSKMWSVKLRASLMDLNCSNAPTRLHRSSGEDRCRQHCGSISRLFGHLCLQHTSQLTHEVAEHTAQYGGDDDEDQRIGVVRRGQRIQLTR